MTETLYTVVVFDEGIWSICYQHRDAFISPNKDAADKLVEELTESHGAQYKVMKLVCVN